VIYKKKWIDLVQCQRREMRQNQIHIWSGIARAATQLKFPWAPITMGEDWERLARMKRAGVEILGLDGARDLANAATVDRKILWDNDYMTNDVPTDFQADRERRYAKNEFQLAIRWYHALVDSARGNAYHSFHDFYATYKRLRGDSIIARFAFAATYAVAKSKGIYYHDDNLSNDDYVMGR
jgi:hypothetical protein